MCSRVSTLQDPEMLFWAREKSSHQFFTVCLSWWRHRWPTISIRHWKPCWQLKCMSVMCWTQWLQTKCINRRIFSGLGKMCLCLTCYWTAFDRLTGWRDDGGWNYHCRRFTKHRMVSYYARMSIRAVTRVTAELTRYYGWRCALLKKTKHYLQKKI